MGKNKCGKYVNDGDYHHWYKEDEQPDNKTVLEPSDDAANIRVGADWRMPTFEEWQELMDSGNCSWIWVFYKGVNGCLVQSKKAGFTDNWIFLPAAGEKDEEKCYGAGARGGTGRAVYVVTEGSFSGLRPFVHGTEDVQYVFLAPCQKVTWRN